MPEPRTRRKARRKPAKPNPSFPLTPHNNGQWCKKIRGKIQFFGVWEDPRAALNNYLRIAADLHAEKPVRMASIHSGGPTVKEVCNHYPNHQFQKVQTDGIRASTFEDCRQVAEGFARFVGATRAVGGLTPADFQRFRVYVTQHGPTGKSKGLGLHAQSRIITIVRSIFKHAYDGDLIDRPLKFGTGLEKPPATLKRKARRAAEMENGKRLFTPNEIRSMLKAADPPLRAMILLGINGGFGNTDCSRLPIRSVDSDRGVIEFDRPKTGIKRVIPLWPETRDALRQTLVERPSPATDETSKLVFLTAYGQPWVRETLHLSSDNSIEKVVAIDAISHEFTRLLSHLGIKRKGVGFTDSHRYLPPVLSGTARRLAVPESPCSAS